MTHTHVTAPTQFLECNGNRFAYRRLGPAEGIPVVLLQHFTGTMDSWDPVVVDGFARDRQVILFDNTGVGGSSGETPATVREMARQGRAFIERQARRAAGRDPNSTDRAVDAQFAAIVEWGGTPTPEAATRTRHTIQPVLVVNGRTT